MRISVKDASGNITYKTINMNDTSATVVFSSVTLTVTRSDTSVLPEYSVLMHIDNNVCLDSISFSEDIEDICGENALIYDAGAGTNAFAAVRKPCDCKNMFSRDIFMVRGDAGEFGIAVTSFDTFYTYFSFDGKKVSLIYDMECKNVSSGTTYSLESFAFSLSAGLDFFEKYTDLIANKYAVSNTKPIPCGWSSWSCYAGGINDKKIYEDALRVAQREMKRGANLLQIDDGWEKCGSFEGIWTEDTELFFSIKDLSDRLKALGFTFGLWVAPGILSPSSQLYKEHGEMLNRIDGELIHSFGGGYPMDIGREDVLQNISNVFTHLKDDVKADYFKIDFIGNLLYRAGNKNTAVHYGGGYSVGLYRRFLKTIREACKDSFLLACGATIGESIGYFDAIRISPDITWGGCGADFHPGAFNLLRMDYTNSVLRSPYHRKVFINDPDALLLRGKELANSDDGLCLSYEEAKMRACAVAMSGGHILLNENTQKLPEDKMSLFDAIIPPLGIAARPVDFFEYPYPTRTVAVADANTKFYAIYNWEDEPQTYSLPLDEGKWAFVDCFKREITGVFEHSVEFIDMEPHTCKAFLAKRITSAQEPFYCPDCFFLGYSTVFADKPMYCDGLPEYYLSASKKGFNKIDNKFNIPLFKKKNDFQD